MSTQPTGGEQQQQHAEPLLLPPPSQENSEEAQSLEVGGAGLKLDKLGPMVVNSDGVSLTRHQSMMGGANHLHHNFFSVDGLAYCELGDDDRDRTRSRCADPKQTEPVSLGLTYGVL